jgi:hypothetical protein
MIDLFTTQGAIRGKSETIFSIRLESQSDDPSGSVSRIFRTAAYSWSTKTEGIVFLNTLISTTQINVTYSCPYLSWEVKGGIFNSLQGSTTYSEMRLLILLPNLGFYGM